MAGMMDAMGSWMKNQGKQYVDAKKKMDDEEAKKKKYVDSQGRLQSGQPGLAADVKKATSPFSVLFKGGKK